MSVEIRIRLTTNGVEPIASISLVEIGVLDAEIVSDVWNKSLSEFCNQKHPQINLNTAEDIGKSAFSKFKEICSPYCSEQELLDLLAGSGGENQKAAEELAAKLPPEIMILLTEIHNKARSNDGQVVTVIDAIDDFLKEIELKVQPLYVAGLNKLSAQYLRRSQ